MSDLTSPATGEPEYLGDGGPGGPGPRWGLVAGAGLAVAAVVAAGGFGLAQLLSSPGSPADAVPANALVYASLDLDPSASQKIAAIQMLRKFPALKEQLDLDARDDVRRWVFTDVLADAGCRELSYDEDVAPWVGDRMAVAAVPDQGATVAPLFALQVSDADAARAGLQALADCAEEKVGVAFAGDYALISDDQAKAESYAGAAEAAPLSADDGFTAWTERLGDPGVVNAYVSAEAPARLTDLAAEAAGDAGLGDSVTELYRDFEGAAAALRFADGRLELALVSKGMPGGLVPAGEPGAPPLGELPASTAAAFSVSFPENWLEDWFTSVGDLFGGAAAGTAPEDQWAELEAQTGLQLPEDLEALLGDGLRISVDASLDVSALDGAEVPTAPVAVKINGDAAEIERVLDTLLRQVPPSEVDVLKRVSGDGYVVLGLDETYVDRLAAGGSELADSEAFGAVVPEADRVSGGLYVNFDADDWATRLAEQLVPQEPDVVANIEPLDALGVSSWLDDDGVQHGQVILSTD